MSQVSPFKFVQQSNTFKLGTNPELGNELRLFFNDRNNDYLWKLSTHRQTITYALRNTEYINLRYLEGPTATTTMESNQNMDVGWAKTINIPIFKKSVEWFASTLTQTGATIEFGRIFVSKLAPNSKIDLHVDQGKYFSYYDRFHFTVTAALDNLFVIEDKECILEQDSLYWVDNHVPHWLENKSNERRINFIIDARLS
jgi:hypothetical protein